MVHTYGLLSFWSRSLRMGGLAAVLAICSCTAADTSHKVKRTPLEKSKAVLRSPTTWEHRSRVDPKTGKEVRYDPKPAVEVVDEKSGKYILKWIGYDGTEKRIEYQRADAIDAVVSASATKNNSGEWVYSYRVDNLPTSSTSLSGFIVQNFSPDTKPIEVGGKTVTVADLRLLDSFRNAASEQAGSRVSGIYIGQMSNSILLFKEGKWIDFSPLPSFEPQVTAGHSFEVKLVSSSPPGFVGCRVIGGELMLKGAGEHMPSELEAVMPGYEEWPQGNTIGPVASLKPLSQRDRVAKLKELLPIFQKLGWITPAAQARYEKNLAADALPPVLMQAEQDLKAEQITTEVFAMLQALLNPDSQLTRL